MADVDKDVTDDIEEKDDVVEDEEETTEDTTDEEPEEETEPDPEKVDVPIRTTALQHIIGRQKRKIEKLKDKVEDDDDEDISPEAKSAIQKEIDEAIKPFRESVIEAETTQLLNELYQSEPEAKKYDKIIRKYINFEKNGVKPYALIPPAAIFHDLAYHEAASAGAEEGRKADEGARITRTRGRGIKPKGSKKTASGLPSIEEMKAMSDDEFNKIAQPNG